MFNLPWYTVGKGVARSMSKKIYLTRRDTINVSLCSTMLHETSSRSAEAWSVLNGITQSYLPATRFIPARVEPQLVIYIHNLQQQSPTVY